jgi:hypothetical protein
MGERLTGDDFNSLFRYFTSTAFRLETRPVYTVDDERESIEEFLAGSPRPYTEFGFYAAWHEQIRTLTAQGKRVHRIRVLDDPPTNYQRWEIWTGTFSTTAGEIIGYIDRARAEAVGLPTTDDWWMFDSARVARMRFDEHGHPLGGEIFTDPVVVAQHCAWWDLAVHHASDHSNAADGRDVA